MAGDKVPPGRAAARFILTASEKNEIDCKDRRKGRSNCNRKIKGPVNASEA